MYDVRTVILLSCYNYLYRSRCVGVILDPFPMSTMSEINSILRTGSIFVLDLVDLFIKRILPYIRNDRGQIGQACPDKL